MEGFNPDLIGPDFIKPEKKEQEKFSHIKVFRVRHGDTEYYEHTQEKELGPDDFDITSKGEGQMRTAAETIERELNKDEDVVCIVTSPRIRTQNGKKIIGEYLKDRGFLLWNDARMDKPQDRVRNIDVYGEDGDVVPVGDEQYPEIFNQVIADLEERTPENMSRDAYMRKDGHEKLESFEDIGKRSRRQLSGFMRIAKRIQPKLDRRIVIIQLEHCETLDDFYEQASSGEYAMINDSGPSKGDVVELDIPVDGDEIRVEFLEKEVGKKRKIKFDYLSGEFTPIKAE